MAWLLKGGRVVDGATDVREPLDVLLKDGVIAAVGRDLPPAPRELDCRGKYVVPGLIDIGARLGEPGFEHRETIASATRAAAAGGFTAVCALPEADPVPDTPQAMRFIAEQAARKGVVRVHAMAALTKGSEGRELTETGAIREAGAVALVALHDVPDSGVLRRTLQYAGMFRIPVILRGSDRGLADGGVMHEGAASTIRGVKGVPAAAEDAAVGRNLIVAELTGTPVHLMALSTAYSVELVRRAKKRGVPVSASVSAQQLAFTADDVQTDDASWKVDPPFRSAKHVEALRKGVADGTVDIIFSDHAPWSREEKDVEFELAPFGMTGLETALPLVLTELVGAGLLSIGRVVQCMSAAPAAVFGVPGGSLQAGAPADVTVIDATTEGTFRASASHSQSRNTPVDGRDLIGGAVATFVGGKLIMRDGEVGAQWTG